MRIKDLRKDRAISQSQLAHDIGITQVCLCRYESGKRKTPLPILVKIADYFNVTTDELLGRNTNENAG